MTHIFSAIMECAVRKLLFSLFAIELLVCFSAQAAQLNKVAAVVNGQVITMFDLQKNASPDLARAHLNPNNPAQAKAVDAVLRKTLDGMIMEILIAQEAKRLKVSVSSSEVDSEISKIMQARGLSKQQFEAQLAQQKMSVGELRKNLEKSILRQKIMGMEVGRRVVVTPEEIKAYYEAHKDTLYDRKGLHMGLIVYHPKAPAAELASKIKSGTMSFAAVAAKYSIAPNRDRAGDMGPVEWDKLNPEWEGRLTKMKPGDVTDIFTLPAANGQKLKAQVRLFRPDGGEAKLLTFEQAKPLIDGILRQPKAMERFDDYSEQLRKKAVIDIRM